ncbi:putative SEC14-like protein 2-like [Apostichopus japonicus]|uniref:Putative SEC14-like protein 2-like n=1 Tax=Stichopus japonicus TaxID=307972 RepID=A0A2G8KUG3_STIJA|nr:putative SEC14-like protein 2-like [Apostichopus japonicus]
MLRDHFEFRVTYDCDNILTNWKPPEVLTKYMIGGMFGEDRDGHPVWYDPYGCLDTKGVFYSCTRHDFLKYKILACERIQQDVDKCNEKEARAIETVNVVFDLQHAGLLHIWRPFIDRYSQVLTAYEANYPESLRRGIVINAPKMFTVGFQLIKPFLSEETKEKVMILGSNYKEKLLEFIHPDQLPICFGGKVPSSFYLNRRSSKCREAMDTCTVLNGKFQDVVCEVIEAGSHLQWDFETENENISFGVFLQQNGFTTPKTIIPSMKCDCNTVPERGEIICAVPGNYMIRFDNSYSWMKSKKVFYSINVVPPAIDHPLPV